MKKIHVNQIIKAIKEMCMEANYRLPKDVKNEISRSIEVSDNNLERKTLELMLQNIEMAENRQLPICQDTGMVVVYITMGQNTCIEGGFIEDAIHKGVASGYEKGYLRKSIVEDPILRNNTKNNCPAVIYYRITREDCFHITLSAKGFGSENTSRIKMLKPADGINGVIDFVTGTVIEKAPNACAPVVVGVGLGGTFEKAASMSKEALMRPLNQPHLQTHIRELEGVLLRKINDSGVGPMGFSGKTTALAVHVETYPTHIAGLPVAVNICCYLNRHVTRSL